MLRLISHLGFNGEAPGFEVCHLGEIHKFEFPMFKGLLPPFFHCADVRRNTDDEQVITLDKG